MNVNNWADIFTFGMWIIVIIIGTWFGNRSLKLKKLGLKSQFLKILVQNAVNSYENTNLKDSEKKKAVVKEVAQSLNNKGFKVSDQTLMDIGQSVETAVKEIEQGSSNHTNKGETKNDK